MCKKIFKPVKLIFITSMVAFCTVVLSPTVIADDDDKDNENGNIIEVKKIEAIAVTGVNRVLGEAQWDLGHGLGVAGLTLVGGFDPESHEPTVLTPDSDENTTLATTLDANYLALFDLAPTDIDPALVNVPLRDVAVIADPAGNRMQLSPLIEVPGGGLSRSAPNSPITVKQWLEGEGSLKIKCKSDGTATVNFKFDNLLENGVYSLWGIYAVEGVNHIVPYPLGGVPNAFVAGDGGKARTKRLLNFCPMDEAIPGAATLLMVDIVYHSDGVVYAGSVDLALAGKPAGTVAHTALAFPINVTDITP
ncbi:MAG: hypothetical protein KAS93_08055 [Gammaproteobacteria bacterium]|nr:hypothetical protein [Gammaproteobacteria bacterium]